MQEKGCLITFKTKADSDRHFRLMHKNRNNPNNPLGRVSMFEENNVVCGQVFPTNWYLKKHKMSWRGN